MNQRVANRHYLNIAMKTTVLMVRGILQKTLRKASERATQKSKLVFGS